MLDEPPEPHRIATSNQQAATVVDEANLVEAVRLVLTREGIADAEISVAIVDGETMQNLNARFLSHDYDTDVLSFLLESTDTPAGPSLEGEVIVSAATAEREAARFKWTTQNELVLYVVHGTLHLCGYDDQTPETLAEMRSRERMILGELGLTPHYAEADDS